MFPMVRMVAFEFQPSFSLLVDAVEIGSEIIPGQAAASSCLISRHIYTESITYENGNIKLPLQTTGR